MTITYIGHYEELAPFHRLISDKLSSSLHIHFMADRYIPDQYFLEFAHPRANKKDALLKWCELTGTDASKVTVFGDQINDIGMFETAGFKFAVSNAHESLISLASGMVDSNDDNGVAQYIEHQLRLLNARFH